MVYIATRGDGPPRVGPEVPQIPPYGPSILDRGVYGDPARFELERRRVLGKSWLIAARSEAMTQPGDWVSFEGHGETVVIVRQRDGGVAAFHNVCQHRGVAIVSDERGCGARRFKCPYHGWVYDTRGRLVGVPEREDFDRGHLDGLRAPAVAVEEWGGWVWINLSGPDAASSLAEWIGPEIVDDLERFRMDDMVLHEKLTWDVPVNYKAIVDGFNEIYHATELHHSPPENVRTHRMATFHVVGRNSMMFVPRPGLLDELRDTLDHHRYTICHYVVFPNTVFNCNPEHIQVFNPIPVDVDRTRFICWELVYGGDQGDPEYREYLTRTMQNWEFLKRVVGEDVGIYDELARTKRSSAYTQNILSAREFKIAKYHRDMGEMIEGPG